MKKSALNKSIPTKTAIALLIIVALLSILGTYAFLSMEKSSGPSTATGTVSVYVLPPVEPTEKSGEVIVEVVEDQVNTRT